MKHNPKVVPITRSAAYVHHRAMKNMRDNNPVDALELMRTAVERSPDNSEYRLDLAEFYCEMGCHEQSNRILLDMIANGGAPAECYYGLALNQLGRNELESARRALMIYRRHAGDDEYIEDAAGLADEIEYMRMTKRPQDRRLGRAARQTVRAGEALRKGETQRGLRMLRASLEANPDRCETRAMYALALRLAERTDEAAEQAELIADSENASVRALCIAAQVFSFTNHEFRAKQTIRRVMDQKPTDADLRLLIYSLGEMKMHVEAAEAARMALRETPHDKTMLHVRAVALKLCGADDRAVLPLWQRILRIDPDDTIARYYFETAQRGELSQIELDYFYDVPQSEFARRTADLSAPLARGLGEAVERCKSDRNYRNLLIWAAGSGDADCARAAMMVLASTDAPCAESAVRELLYRGNVLNPAKMYATFFLSLRGADINRFLPPDSEVGDALLPESDELLSSLPVGERQLIRFANDVLELHYDCSAMTGLATMWYIYRKNSISGDPLVCTQEAAAALAWNFLLSRNIKPKPDELSRQFECKKRRMMFYARHMAAVLERATEVDRNEDR